MTDPLTATAIGAVVLTEGIRFVYGQAGELLKRWRERRAATDEQAPVPGPPLEPPADLLVGPIAPTEPDLSLMPDLERVLVTGRRGLADYVEGIEPVDVADASVWQQFDTLRQALELVYGQRLTLPGEQRPSGGPLVVGRVDVERLLGAATGADVGDVTDGEVRGEVRAGTVEEGGSATGVRVRHVGR